MITPFILEILTQLKKQSIFTEFAPFFNLSFKYEIAGIKSLKDVKTAVSLAI